MSKVEKEFIPNEKAIANRYFDNIHLLALELRDRARDGDVNGIDMILSELESQCNFFHFGEKDEESVQEFLKEGFEF